MRLFGGYRAFHTEEAKPDQLLAVLKSECASQSTAPTNHLTRGIAGADGIPALYGRKCAKELMSTSLPQFQPTRNYIASSSIPQTYQDKSRVGHRIGHQQRFATHMLFIDMVQELQFQKLYMKQNICELSY
ncbi:putative mitochondrial import inner membrane translocase subunit TIM21 [Prunus yedoensis var. nudiflora]|uniref:Putative mitochondrial import inner membrane translocase subunit TIM21 n=1 Tax=Prunus yedoensis var. nudiflora TaxID=2094558 RepID=A0A314YVX0_PRUYE|nr:putative mitochondrial import inner membrane translocase subunit TIM21 [Prunus yedoensis var. nudiflora]